MGLFFKKRTRLGLDRKKVVASYAVLGVCILLVAVNIASFIFFPRLMQPLAILISNAITIVLTVFAFRPINALIEHELEKRQGELLAQAEKERSLEEEVNRLEVRNHELENKLDTHAQTEGAVPDINFTFKLEQMEYAKKGYVVKEEPLEAFLSDDRYRNQIPEIGPLTKLFNALKLKENGIRKIFYVKKFYYKVSIGIDFSRIKFAFNGDRLLLSGVKFTRLHDISSEMQPDQDDIDRCWILNTTDQWAEIKQSDEYEPFKNTYARLQEAETREALDAEVERLCAQYTDVFRRNIQARFVQVDFMEGIEQSDLSWYALKDGGSYRMVRDIASHMLLLTDVIGETKSIEEQVEL